MAANNRILSKLLDRLFAALTTGPSLNARPHSSRQRIDLTSLAKLGDAPPRDVLRQILGEERGAKLRAKIDPPNARGGGGGAGANGDDEVDEQTLTPEERQAAQAWKDQQTVLQKLRAIAEDARVYEQDTGAHVLHVGFPLLSLPPGSFAISRSSASTATKRVLAPVAFVPVSVVVKRGASQSVEITCKGEGTDRVMPNTALLAWLEQQTGKEAASDL